MELAGCIHSKSVWVQKISLHCSSKNFIFAFGRSSVPLKFDPFVWNPGLRRGHYTVVHSFTSGCWSSLSRVQNFCQRQILNSCWILLWCNAKSQWQMWQASMSTLNWFHLQSDLCDQCLDMLMYFPSSLTLPYLSIDHTVDCRWNQLSVDMEARHICHWFLALHHNRIQQEFYVCIWQKFRTLKVSSFCMNNRSDEGPLYCGPQLHQWLLK